MLGSTFEGCRGLRLEMVEVYWLLLTPVTLIAMVLEFYKRTLDFGEIVKRVFLSLFFLWSFEYVTEIIAFVSDGIVERMGGLGRLSKVLKELQKSFQGEMPGMMQFRQMLIFLINFACYLIALLSFYLTEILSHFIYAVLYVVSPLAFLCMIPTQTQHIPKNIYKGIINIAIWRILWSILGAMLFEFIRSPMVTWGNFVMSALVNLCIGASMLLIPFFASSLVSDGGRGVASAAVSLGTLPVLGGIKGIPMRAFRRITKKRKGHMTKRKTRGLSNE